MTASGRFITVEGGEGVGKSSNIEFLTSLLRDAGIDVICTREPGGTALAEQIRGILLSHGDEPVPDVAETLLFFAARKVNVDNLIKPALAKGQWVICDRFTDATRAYQGAGRGLDAAMIDRLADWVQEGLEPDLTLLLDAPVAVGQARASGRSAPDRMESEAEAFHERVREAYLTLAEKHPDRFRVIDAALDLEHVRSQIRQVIEPFINDASH